MQRLLWLFLVTATSAANYCNAAIIVDQSSVNPATGLAGTINVQGSAIVEQAQTFTVGLTGPMTQFDLKIVRKSATNQPLLIDIRTTDNGAPTEANQGANILFQTSINAGLISTTTPGFQDFYSVQIQGGLQVVAGQQLAIVLRTEQTSPPSSSPRGYEWFAPADSQITTPYQGGDMYTRVSTIGTWMKGSPYDYDFRTYVDAVAVPEPGTVSFLLLSGIAMVLRSRYQSRRTTNLK